jgi:isoquinoline 1-oxidoreductase alpha subunit
MLTLNINRHPVDVTSDPATPLLWVLRCELKMTGTKFGCGVGVCGACTVHLCDKQAVSCQQPISDIGAKEITTIEQLQALQGLQGLRGRQARALVDAWTRIDVVQCGYCQSAQLMAAWALLIENPCPTEQGINEAMKGIICRCGTYPRIKAAILDAVGQTTTP